MMFNRLKTRIIDLENKVLIPDLIDSHGHFMSTGNKRMYLDLLGERVPHYDYIAKIATLADRGKVKMVVSALSYPTVH